MPIYFAVVARGCVILAKYASVVGNFASVAQQVLVKIPAQRSLHTFKYENFYFHCIREEDMVYMCIADAHCNKLTCFAFLRDIQHRFADTYGVRMRNAPAYAMNSDFSIIIARQMKQWNENSSANRLLEMGEQMTDLKSIVAENIDVLVDRGERLEFLVDRSKSLEASTVSFRDRGRTIANNLKMKNVKWVVTVIVVFLAVLFFVVTFACGGFSYSHCRSA